MAEDKDSNKEKSPFLGNSFNKGLHQDLAPENQPEGTYRFALNGVLESQEGNFSAISNEQSNYDCIQFPQDFVPIGSIYMSNDERVIFLVKKNIPANPLNFSSIIGVANKCNFEVLVEDTNLNFQVNKPIKGIFRIRNGCERNIYFVDGFNNDRAINLDRLDIYKDANGDWITSEFNLIRRRPPIEFRYSGVEEQGGRTKIGRFQLSARYLDEYNNALPPMQFTVPFNVVPNQYQSGTQMFAVDGGLLSDNDISSKSFRFQLLDIDIEFPFLEILALETSNGTTSAYVVDRINISNQDSLPWTYTGTDGSYAYPLEITEATDAGIRETTSIAITQADNRLIRANTSEPTINWEPFIKASNETEIRWFSQLSSITDSKLPNAITSFMGDEVYALGLRWIIDDYIESPVFHIPGRGIIDDPALVTVGNANPHSRPQLVASSNWDKQTLLVSAKNVDPSSLGSNVVSWEDVQPYSEDLNPGDTVERWKIFNTSIRQSFTVNAINYDGGYTGYHESECERYPLVLRCNGNPAVANDYLYPVETFGDKFRGQLVRHHRMPDRTLVGIQETSTGTTLNSGIASNIHILALPPVPDGYEASRLKLQLVAVPRDKNNSTVIDAGLITLAPYMAAFKADSDYGTSPSDVSGSDYTDYRKFHIGNSAEPGPTREGYGCVTTNYNIAMTNVPNLSNNGRPSSWYYTHFISPSFTHLNEDFKYSHYKLERMLYGPLRLELIKHAADQPNSTDNDKLPELLVSLALNKEAIPGASTPSPGLWNFQGTTAGSGVALNKISKFPLWTNRKILHGEQISFNESALAERVVSRSTYSTELTSRTQFSSLPTGLTRFGSTMNQRHQKGFIAVSPIDQRIVDPINSWTQTAGPSTTNTFDVLFNGGNSLAVNLLDAFSESAVLFEGIKFCTISIGVSGSDEDKRYGWHAYYGTIKNGNKCAYQGLDTLQYRPISKVTEFLEIEGGPYNNKTALEGTDGDCFISRFDYVNTVHNREHLRSGGTYWQDPVIATTSQVKPLKSIITNDIKFLVESPLNVNLASNDVKNSLTYFPYSSFSNGLSVIRFDSRYHNGVEPKASGRSFQEIAYLYNKDFSKLNIENVYISLPHTFNFCSECINKNKNRIYYSESSNVEELTDFYRIFLVNNYKDIPAETGEIVDITDFNNAIVIDTEEAKYLQRYGQQQLQTDESTISIGTGGFFSLKEDKIANSEIGFYGNQSRFANNKSEYGLFTVDARFGKVFLSSDFNPKTISSIGLNTWFRNNLPLQFKAQVEQLIIDGNLNTKFNTFDYDTPQNVLFPIGLISAIDTKFNRIILTKHDWLLTDNDEELNGYNLFKANQLQYIGGRWILGFDTIIPRNRPDLFENKSWTISYSLKDQCWASFHSYMPNFMFGNKLEFFSYTMENLTNNISTDKLVKHNKFNHFQTFNNEHYPHILEIVTPARSPIPVIYDHLQFNTVASQFDTVKKEYVDKRFITFDKAYFYNSHQNSGMLNLVTKKKSEFFTRQFRNISGEAIIDVNEKTYSINGFKDLISDNNVSMFSTHWDDVQNQYYIDKVINTSSINLQKNWYEREVFRDRYLISRLFFSIFVNTKLTTNLSMFKTSQTIR